MPLFRRNKSSSEPVEQPAAHGDIERLIAVLEDSTISPMIATRQEAADALGGIGDVRAAEPLARQLVNPENDGSSLPVAAREALKKLGDAGVDALVRTLRTAEGAPSDTAVTAIQHLAKIGGPRGREGVERFAEDFCSADGTATEACEEAQLRLKYWSDKIY